MAPFVVNPDNVREFKTEDAFYKWLKANHDIPIGHKAALRDIKTGDTIWKYGQDIGKAIADIGRGEHVHVHNVKTKRW